MPTEPSFRYLHPVEVRFRDLDPMGHAHHALPLIYFEEARAAYWRDVAGRSAGLEGIDYVMAEAVLHYHARIRFPARLLVGVRTTRLGGKSLEMEYELRDEEGALLASGSTVQVMFDYDAGVSKPIPDEIRSRIAAYESL